MPNKNVLLTGASGGIGKHLSRYLAQNGYNLALQYNTNPEIIHENLKDITTPAANYKIYKADITSEQEVTDMINAAKSDLGSIDILINNAGLSINSMSWKLTSEDWNKVIAVNLTGPFYCTKHVLPLMKEEKFAKNNLYFIGCTANRSSRNSSIFCFQSRSWRIMQNSFKRDHKEQHNCQCYFTGLFRCRAALPDP